MQFSNFHFHPAIVNAINDCGYKEPTLIQQQAIPHLLEGRDLLGLAQTGTGKTAAFVLPTLQRLTEGKRKRVRALILTPTRELAEQVHSNIIQMAGKTGLRSCTIYGGVPKFGQVKKLSRGVELVVACPGRLLDHLDSGTINLSGVETLILDEADQMFDKGFLPDIRRIMKRIPRKRQSMVFSATMPAEIRSFVEEILDNQVTVQVDYEKPAETISHVVFRVSQARKTALLRNLLTNKNMETTLVFTRTKHKAKNLAKQLASAGFMVTSLEGNMSQKQRQISMDGFRTGKFNILVATDIAARGIDVSRISHVVNYDVPDTVEAYTHRTGRTGRAEKNGEAFTFATIDDGRIVQFVEKKLGQKIRRETIEGFDYGVEKPLKSPGRRPGTGMRQGKKPGTASRSRSSWKGKGRTRKQTGAAK
jgi:ATP-dependent RNA helicase RhlE